MISCNEAMGIKVDLLYEGFASKAHNAHVFAALLESYHPVSGIPGHNSMSDLRWEMVLREIKKSIKDGELVLSSRNCPYCMSSFFADDILPCLQATDWMCCDYARHFGVCLNWDDGDTHYDKIDEQLEKITSYTRW